MDKSWKAVERKAARSLGTERTPLSGGNSKQTRSDSLHDEIYLETKHRNHFSVLSLYRETLFKARKENKVAVLCLKEKGKHGELAVVDWKLFAELWNKSREETE